MLVLGAVLITLSSQVKLPGLLALGFVTVALARRWGGSVTAFLSAAGCLGTLPRGDGARRLGQWTRFRWLFTLGTANVVRSWMSPPTLIALGTGRHPAGPGLITPPPCCR